MLNKLASSTQARVDRQPAAFAIARKRGRLYLCEFSGVYTFAVIEAKLLAADCYDLRTLTYQIHFYSCLAGVVCRVVRK